MNDENVFPENGQMGMTLREYYAGLAMQGMYAANARDFAWIQSMAEGTAGGRIIAEAAVVAADALVEALREGREPPSAAPKRTDAHPRVIAQLERREKELKQQREQLEQKGERP